MGEKTEAQKRAHRKYMEKFVEVKVRMTPERRSAVQAHAETQGESTTGFINRAIVNQIAADNGVQIGAVAAQEWQQAALPPETVEAAQRAAEATGEATQDFMGGGYPGPAGCKCLAAGYQSVQRG